MILAIFVLAVYGLANSIAVLKAGRLIRDPLGALSEFWKGSVWGLPIRFLEALLKCPPCLSFWIGMAASFWLFSPSASFVESKGGQAWMSAIVDGLAVCGASWILHVATMRMCVGIEKILEIEKVDRI